MSKPSSFSLRGRKALIASKDDRDLSIVRRQLERLGIEIVAWERDSDPQCRVDVVLIDDEFLPLSPAMQRAFLSSPVIALLGTETRAG